MLLFPAYLAPSFIRNAGVGLYSRILLPKDMLLWRFDSRLDRLYSKVEFEALPEDIRNHVKIYGFPADEKSGSYILDGDFGKFVNHSVNPNTHSVIGLDGGWWANEDIPPHTELTDDYRSIYPDMKTIVFATV